MKAGITRTDDSFALALEMCRQYTTAFTEQVNFDWRQARRSPQRQRVLLSKHLEQFLEREHWIDQRFTRGSQDDVPRALRSIARREFRVHGLENHEPVLTVGAPDSFETHKSDLFSFLFDGLFVAAGNTTIDALRFAPKLSVISVPYIEGTRALWHPIIVGHEIAHVRLDHTHGLHDRSELTQGWLSDDDDEWLHLQVERLRTAPARVSPRLDVQRVLERWVDELLCDLNAVRLFGPAGLSAIAEFLVLLDAGGKGAERATETHPPLSVRLNVLFRYVERLGYADLPGYARVWESYVASTRTVLDPESRFLVRLVTDAENVDRLIQHVQRWGPECDAEAHAPAVDWVAQELLDGVPGGTHRPGNPWKPVEVADVVNAAWAARYHLDDPSPSAEATPRGGALLDSGLSERDKRLRIDSLASKAIDSIELSKLWGSQRGMIALDHPSITGPAQAADESSDRPRGAFSRASIAQRLVPKGSLPQRDRMVMTPLFTDSLHDAGVDVRLGPDFIVFRHSSTMAFDPVDYEQDPRAVQERVHKGWGERFVLHPGELVLASTLEYIVLPDDIAAQVLTRSSYGRLGLLTATAVQIQPGSHGCITLELVNHAQTPIALTPGVRIAQLMLFPISAPCEVSRGRYWFPVGPEFSKVHEDRDAPALQRIATAASQIGGVEAVRFTYAAAQVEASAFEHLAESRGVNLSTATVPLDQPSSGGHGIGPPEVALLILSGTAAVSALADIAFRWRRERQRSILLTESDDGTVGVQVLSADAPTGLVIVRDKDGIEVDRVDEKGTWADVADALARMIGRRSDAPRLPSP